MARRELQQQALGDLGGILAGFRNKVINGDFDIWQRGTSFSTGYTADRWVAGIGAGAAVTISRQSFTIGQTDVPGNPKYFCRFNRTTTGSTPSVINQRIEGVATLAGKRVTRTWWLKGSASFNAEVDLIQNFGTGGSPSTTVAVEVTAVALTTSWTKYTATFDVPSISGKTLGSNGDDFLEMRMTLPTAAGIVSVDIAHVSLVEGDATQEDDPFSRRHIAQELLLCERYYKGLQSLMGIAPNTTNVIFSVPNINMRTVPTVTLGSTAMMVSDIFANDFTGAGSAVSTTYSLTANGGLINMSGFTGLTAGRVYEMRDSNKILFSAEL